MTSYRILCYAVIVLLQKINYHFFRSASGNLPAKTHQRNPQEDSALNLDMLRSYLQNYNDHELFYKRMYEARKSDAAIRRFIESLEPAEVRRKKLIVPEFPDTVPSSFLDEEYFSEEKPRTVILEKHNRFTPLFFHSHAFFELVFVISGTCEHHIGNQTVLLSEGDLCLISPSVYHSIGVFSDSIVLDILIRKNTLEKIFYNLIRDQDILSTFFLNSLYTKGYSAYITFHTEGDREIEHMLGEMYMEQLQQDNFFDEIISSMMAIFLVKIVRKYKKTMELSDRNLGNNLTISIMRYVHSHYSTGSLAELASEMGYSIPYCSELVKKLTGFGFSRLLGETRIRQAEYLLQTSHLSISDVSAAVGYENPENFIRAFKKTKNMTPSQYRELSRRFL